MPSEPPLASETSCFCYYVPDEGVNEGQALRCRLTFPIFPFVPTSAGLPRCPRAVLAAVSERRKCLFAAVCLLLMPFDISLAGVLSTGLPRWCSCCDISKKHSSVCAAVNVRSFLSISSRTLLIRPINTRLAGILTVKSC